MTHTVTEAISPEVRMFFWSWSGAMSDPRDIDEDAILKGLSAAELDQLEYELQEMDPENAMLPAGYRQRDQTKKSPTGDYDRDALQDYLEKSALEHEDREDLIPFTGEKKGKAFVPTATGQIPVSEQITLEPELEEALKNATDAEMCDIAATSSTMMLWAAQAKIANTEGINSVVKADPFKIFLWSPQTTTNVEETIEKIHNNDSGTDGGHSHPHAVEVFGGHEGETLTVEFLSIAATRSNDPVAHVRRCCRGCCRRTPVSRVLNIESNFITAEGMTAIIKAIGQQRHAGGAQDRQPGTRRWGTLWRWRSATMLENNSSILKFGYHFHPAGAAGPGPPMAITRNNDMRSVSQNATFHSNSPK
ncbi:Tropomodulin-4 [Merluccius polli]|uniref:Tropomodulin-4 n=1 Tax=Merluccius polli TaxID=89951 RepID=A0AA47MNF3_MERPO|nr:Tropomodulin-4 [Merluccius polli]